MIGAQFELIAPAIGIAFVLACLGYGGYRAVKRIRSFLRASWRRIPARTGRYAVGRDYHNREFIGRDR